MQDKHEAAIDRTLAALNEAKPPEGMEARIQQRLRYHAAQASGGASTWRPARTWWMGALTGAVLATLICALGWFGLRGQTRQTMANNPPTGNHPVRAVSVANRPAEAQSVPVCAEPAVRPRLPRARTPVLLGTAQESAKPAPRSKDELTPQERELVRLAQVADPKELSAMTSEARARADAQLAAAFKDFFTPPPPPPHDLGENE